MNEISHGDLIGEVGVAYAARWGVVYSGVGVAKLVHSGVSVILVSLYLGYDIQLLREVHQVTNPLMYYG